MEEQPDIDEHAHTNEEVGDEEGVADKLYMVHQWRHGRDVAVEDKSGEESTEDTLQPYKACQRGTEKQHGEDKDELHDRVAIAPEKAPRESWHDEQDDGDIQHELHHKPQPEQHIGLAVVAGH